MNAYTKDRSRVREADAVRAAVEERSDETLTLAIAEAFECAVKRAATPKAAARIILAALCSYQDCMEAA